MPHYQLEVLLSINKFKRDEDLVCCLEEGFFLSNKILLLIEHKGYLYGN